jgi:hypothetical protein
VKQHYVQYINEHIQIGRYRPQDIVSIDEHNLHVDQASGETLADRGDKKIGCAMTGSVFKGKDTILSHVWKEFSTEEKRAEHGYPQ